MKKTAPGYIDLQIGSYKFEELITGIQDQLKIVQNDQINPNAKFSSRI